MLYHDCRIWSLGERTLLLNCSLSECSPIWCKTFQNVNIVCTYPFQCLIWFFLIIFSTRFRKMFSRNRKKGKTLARNEFVNIHVNLSWDPTYHRLTKRDLLEMRFDVVFSFPIFSRSMFPSLFAVGLRRIRKDEKKKSHLLAGENIWENHLSLLVDSLDPSGMGGSYAHVAAGLFLLNFPFACFFFFFLLNLCYSIPG